MTDDDTPGATTLHRVEAVAHRAQLSVGFVRTAIARGDIEVVRLGRHLRISEAALREYLQKRSERSGA